MNFTALNVSQPISRRRANNVDNFTGLSEGIVLDEVKESLKRVSCNFDVNFQILSRGNP